MRALYRVVLAGEDGHYVLVDGIRKHEDAERIAEQKQGLYEMNIYVETYYAGSY